MFVCHFENHIDKYGIGVTVVFKAIAYELFICRRFISVCPLVLQKFVCCAARVGGEMWAADPTKCSRGHEANASSAW